MDKPCGCPDDLKDQPSVDFKFDNTGYNVSAVLKLTEDKFVDHPMHIGNYTKLKTPERIALLRKIYQAIAKSAGLELSPQASPQPEIKPNGPETKDKGKDGPVIPKIGDINTDSIKSPN